MVSAASRMFSAISFGVFCRRAPSTSAIMRSRNVSPGIGGDAHDEPVGEHARAAGHGAPVAAALADHRRALAGDGALVHRGDALDDLAVAGDEVARLHEHEVAARAAAADATSSTARVPPRLGEALGDHVLAGPPQRVGLRLAPSLGHGLGEVREEHREPEPQRHRQDEAGGRLAAPGRRPRGRRAAVVNALPISTTNMTGFLASRIADRACGRRRRRPAGRWRGRRAARRAALACSWHARRHDGQPQVLDDRTERERRE